MSFRVLVVLVAAMCCIACHSVPEMEESERYYSAHPDNRIFTDERGDPPPPPESATGGEGEEEEKLNSMALFVGGTWAREGDESGVTIGIDYERELTEGLAVGAYVEAVGGDLREGVLGVVLVLRPVEWLGLVAGPGIERSDRENGWLLRVGALVEFPLTDGWHFGPAVYYDLTEHEEYIVGGLIIGRKF
jgi:hypothetical protein